MSKTVQVRLIVEEFFKGRVTWSVDNWDSSHQKEIDWYFKDVYPIIKSRIDEDIEEDEGLYKFKDGETRETVIQALWEYQKSLLPDGWDIDTPTPDLMVDEAVMISNGEERLYTFYDPASRIVTITKFEGVGE